MELNRFVDIRFCYRQSPNRKFWKLMRKCKWNNK